MEPQVVDPVTTDHGKDLLVDRSTSMFDSVLRGKENVGGRGSGRVTSKLLSMTTTLTIVGLSSGSS